MTLNSQPVVTNVPAGKRMKSRVPEIVESRVPEIRSAKHHDMLGAHMSIAGGTPEAIDRARRVRCNVLQIFVKNNNRWVGKELTPEEGTEFKRRRQKSKLRDVVAHTSYLINLAAGPGEVRDRSIVSFLDEAERCMMLGIDALVVHPGCHNGAGERIGIERTAAAITEIFARMPGSSVDIVLEATAGQGSSIGYRFEHLRDVLARCERPERVKVCLDTCHLFAAGFDLRYEGGYQETIASVDRIIGLEKLRVIHCNDSKRELGSRVDRHEHIGKGKLGVEAFSFLLGDERLAHVPKILETPKGKELKEDRRNLRVLRSLVA